MSKINPREHEISFTICRDGCPKGGSIQIMVVFNKPAKLREHTVKHLISNSDEPISVGDIPASEVQSYREQLRKINCPYMSRSYEDNPPCFAHQKGCHKELCLKIEEINNLESRYLDIILKGVKSCAKMPRYACYYGKGESVGSFLTFFTNSKLMIVARRMQDEKYNVTTCILKYPYEKYFLAARDRIVKKIASESIPKSLFFCSEENWMTNNKPDTSMGIAFQNARALKDEAERKRIKIKSRR